MSELGELKIAAVQSDCIVGDVAGNAERVRKARETAKAISADLVVFSELFLSGYPPEDLVLKPAFQSACRTAAQELAKETSDGGPAILLGLPWLEQNRLYNAYALLDNGQIDAIRFKHDLPNYAVFDEKRVFHPGPLPQPILFRSIKIGLPICEDIWGPAPIEHLVHTGAEILLVPNGSPYQRDKLDLRLEIAKDRVRQSALPMLYVNQVGGQDEILFDGSSFALSKNGAVAGRMAPFQADIKLFTCRRSEAGWDFPIEPVSEPLSDDQADYSACVLGLRDYIEKNRFPGVVLGISGGIDSALCAAMAVDAVGAERVHTLMLPYRYTAQQSLDDARACAQALGIRYDIVPIGAAVEALEQILHPLFAGRSADTTEENLQSRVRGTILMSISNKFGSMVVTTGNKSEMSVGYATLYGDMNGGYNPIKDVYKTQVFRLSSLRNRWKPIDALGPNGVVIPESIIIRPPSAELAENQTDQDSLPPYDELDDILYCLVEQEMSNAETAACGHDMALVKKIERLLYLAEYKRRQSAPGVKITSKNFGRDRRYPIVNGFRDQG